MLCRELSKEMTLEIMSGKKETDVQGSEGRRF